MKDKIKYLSNLNRELKIIEQQIVERAIVCLQVAEPRLKSDDSFTTDYEVCATVEYYLSGDGDVPIQKFGITLIIKKRYLTKIIFCYWLTVMVRITLEKENACPN